eukprot:gene6360-7088_t
MGKHSSNRNTGSMHKKRSKSLSDESLSSSDSPDESRKRIKMDKASRKMKVSKYHHKEQIKKGQRKEESSSDDDNEQQRQQKERVDRLCNDRRLPEKDQRACDRTKDEVIEGKGKRKKNKHDQDGSQYDKEGCSIKDKSEKSRYRYNEDRKRSVEGRPRSYEDGKRYAKGRQTFDESRNRSDEDGQRYAKGRQRFDEGRNRSDEDAQRFNKDRHKSRKDEQGYNESRYRSNEDKHRSTEQDRHDQDRSRHRDKEDRGRNMRDRHKEDRYQEKQKKERRQNEREWDRRKGDCDDDNERQGVSSYQPGPERIGQIATQESEKGNSAIEKEEPNYELSGKLTEFTNTYKGVVIKYNEPPEARKPKTRWRFYPFKGDQELPVLHIHRQSAFLLGRNRMIADIPVDHPSCSSQHAVLQFRLVNYERPDGVVGRKVKPYIIDLDSSNGTFLNNNKIDPRRYYELQERDVLKFGFSSREYVILNDQSKDAGTSEDEEEEKVADKK